MTSCSSPSFLKKMSEYFLGFVRTYESVLYKRPAQDPRVRFDPCLNLRALVEQLRSY